MTLRLINGGASHAPDAHHNATPRVRGRAFAGAAQALREAPPVPDKVPARRYTLLAVAELYLLQFEGYALVTRRSIVDAWVEFLGDKWIEEIDHNMVEAVVNKLAAIPVLKYKGVDRATGEKIYSQHGKRKPATLNQYQTVLSSVFTFAQYPPDGIPRMLARDHIPPTKTVKRSRIKNTDPERALSLEAVQRLIAYSRSAPWVRMTLFVLFALTTAGRRSHILKLTGDDIDLRESCCWIMNKNGIRKKLHLEPIVLAEMKRFGVPVGPELLFPSERPTRSGLVQPFTVNKSFVNLLRRAGIPNARLHDLRHTVGSLLADDGRSLLEIMAVLGHESTKAAQIYAKVSANARNKVVRESTLARTLNKIAGGAPARKIVGGEA